MPILFLLAAAEVEHILRDSAPRVLIVGSEVLPAVQAVVGGLAAPPQVVVIGGEAPAGVHAMDDLLETPEKYPPFLRNRLRSGALYLAHEYVNAQRARQIIGNRGRPGRHRRSR